MPGNSGGGGGGGGVNGDEKDGLTSGACCCRRLEFCIGGKEEGRCAAMLKSATEWYEYKVKRACRKWKDDAEERRQEIGAQTNQIVIGA